MWRPPNTCSNCGRECVKAIDNLGAEYLGCPRCEVLPPDGPSRSQAGKHSSAYMAPEQKDKE